MKLSGKEVFSGYQITGCCITSPVYFSFLLTEIISDNQHAHDESGCVKFVVYDLEREPLEHWGTSTFNPFWYFPRIVHTEFEEFLVADNIGNVYYHGLGRNKQLEDKLDEYDTGITHLKNINGTIYGVSAARSLYRRTGPDNWDENNELLYIPGAEQTSRMGFDCVDGFSEQDIYAAGDDRDVWHFNGQNWTPIDICDQPFECKAICCAEDGYVYIAGRYGMVARGRGDQWQVYSPESEEDDFRSMVCYKGRVFAGTEKHTYVIGDDLVPQLYDFEEQFRNLAGTYLYSAYDKLLLANQHNQIALFDGTQWLNIYGCNDYTEDEGRELLAQALTLADETEDILENLHNSITKMD
ncbi:hypothetical protein [Vibrio quintilis]|uniref:Uncharacterized protein n=1 Tax=Vibrio quintilis TaxID=1117707 RepID=A0A1M7YW60_9VIBR|nr:hypothetical protein [Vibrio quintilis]SHO56851.1 hypothetical protein VQ7734_02620 [Vibrio quintilis]